VLVNGQGDIVDENGNEAMDWGRGRQFPQHRAASLNILVTNHHIAT